MCEKSSQIRKARLKSGMKAKTLAQELGISAAYLSQLEAGVRAVSDETLKKIMEITDRHANFFNHADVKADGNKGTITVNSDNATAKDSQIIDRMTKIIDQRLSPIEQDLSTIKTLLLQLLAK